MPSVAWLTIAPVKGLGLVALDEVVLEPFGVADNRRFYLVDENGRKFDPKPCGEIVQVRPRWDAEAGTLARNGRPRRNHAPGPGHGDARPRHREGAPPLPHPRQGAAALGGLGRRRPARPRPAGRPRRVLINPADF